MASCLQSKALLFILRYFQMLFYYDGTAVQLLLFDLHLDSYSDLFSGLLPMRNQAAI